MKRLAALMGLMGLMAMATQPATAGGIVTNTNQSAAFLRNPCRDASIGIDGVTTNPAGVGFLSEGFHLSLNIQSVRQTRTITSTFGGFAYGAENNGSMTKEFEGEANAPIVPSIQAAYNKGRWSWQAAFCITGGGGKCIFDEDLGSFESIVSLIPMLASAKGLKISSYDYESYLKGRQYYFGLQIGSAYKITDWLSAYGGLRFTYGSCNYHGYLRNIEVGTESGMLNAPEYFGGLFEQSLQAATQCADAASQYAALGDMENAQKYAAMAEQYKASAVTTGTMAEATKDVTLNCDQTGFGWAPSLGVHAKAGNFDFAIRYDFRLRMELDNVAANSESANNMQALAKFADGNKVRDDMAALLTMGVAWNIVEPVRVMVGWHHFFDESAKQYGNKQDLLDGGTNEFLGGAEWDIIDQLQVSCGVQFTRYPFTDAYMNDISFSCDSWTIGCGLGYKINEKVKINLAYFNTTYDTYDKQTNDYNNISNMIGTMIGQDVAQQMLAGGMLKGSDSFSRTNKVWGVGVEFNF